MNNKAALRGLKIIAVGVKDKDVVSWVVIGYDLWSIKEGKF